MVVIDTCSLVNLVRYYMPFDKDTVLYDYIRNKAESGEIVVIDKVYDEFEMLSDKIVVSRLPFLKAVKKSTTDCLPDYQFYHWAKADFVSSTARKKLKSQQEFDAEHDKFMEDADAKLILFCLNNRSVGQNPIIVTDESHFINDGKLYKKIPILCKIAQVDCMSLPKYLEFCRDINISFKRKKTR